MTDIKADILPIRNSIEKLLNRELSESDKELLEGEGYNIEELEQDITEIEQDTKRIEIEKIQRNLTLNQISKMLFDLKIELVKRITFLLILICILIVLSIYLFNVNLYIGIYLILGQLGLLWLTALFYKRKQLILVATSIIIYLVAFACGSGINYGYLQEKHIVFEEKENHFIALTLYKDQFLYAQYDIETNQVEASFNLINIEDVKGFSKRQIGKVKVINKSYPEL